MEEGFDLYLLSPLAAPETAQFECPALPSVNPKGHGEIGDSDEDKYRAEKHVRWLSPSIKVHDAEDDG